MANVKHLASPGGLMQIVHLVFGIIAIGCGAASYESQFLRERFFFWTVVGLLIVSVILLVVNIITGNIAVRLVSSGLHVAGGILLIAAGTLLILNVRYIDNDLCEPNPWGANCSFDKPTKLAAAAFTIMNGILYLAASALLMLVRADDEEEELAGYSRTKNYSSRPATQN